MKSRLKSGQVGKHAQKAFFTLSTTTTAHPPIISLSANIQWVVFSNGTEYLVKVLLNEQEVSLPVPTARWPYYQWKDVKEFYLKKLSS